MTSVVVSFVPFILLDIGGGDKAFDSFIFHSFCMASVVVSFVSFCMTSVVSLIYFILHDIGGGVIYFFCFV